MLAEKVERWVKEWKEQGLSEGRAEGRAEGQVAATLRLMQALIADGILSRDQALAKIQALAASGELDAAAVARIERELPSS